MNETPEPTATRSPEKTLIKGYTLTELTEWCLQQGLKPYRARQLYRWIYQRGARSFDAMTDIARSLREQLDRAFSISATEIVQIARSQTDGTVKFLLALRDSQHIETVLMPEDRRVTVCLSTQVGCAIGCPYCATGRMGFRRHLSAGEIIDQYLIAAAQAIKPVTNVVFMGMGEPFLNYDQTLKAAALLNTELGPEIAARHITISTSGIVPAIYRFTDEGHKFKLAVSLNATADAERDRLIPINSRYPIAELLAAASYYTRKSRRTITFEYILMQGENDSPRDARRLISLLSPIRCKLNIIPFNENPHVPQRQPDEKQLDAFIRVLYTSPMTITVRRSKGSDIAAACGQLFAASAQPDLPATLQHET